MPVQVKDPKLTLFGHTDILHTLIGMALWVTLLLGLLVRQPKFPVRTNEPQKNQNKIEE